MSCHFTVLGVEDNGNLLGLDAGDLAISLDTLHAMACEVPKRTKSSLPASSCIVQGSQCPCSAVLESCS